MNNLEYYRKKKGFSQRELAKKTGLSSAFISQVENELNKPSEESLKLIADALEIEPSKLNLTNRDNEESTSKTIIKLLEILIDLTKNKKIKWIDFDEISEFQAYETKVNDNKYILSVIMNDDEEGSNITEILLEIKIKNLDSFYITSYFVPTYKKLLHELLKAIQYPIIDDYILNQIIDDLKNLLDE